MSHLSDDRKFDLWKLPDRCLPRRLAAARLPGGYLALISQVPTTTTSAHSPKNCYDLSTIIIGTSLSPIPSLNGTTFKKLRLRMTYVPDRKFVNWPRDLSKTTDIYIHFNMLRCLSQIRHVTATLTGEDHYHGYETSKNI